MIHWSGVDPLQPAATELSKGPRTAEIQEQCPQWAPSLFLDSTTRENHSPSQLELYLKLQLWLSTSELF